MELPPALLYRGRFMGTTDTKPVTCRPDSSSAITRGRASEELHVIEIGAVLVGKSLRPLFASGGWPGICWYRCARGAHLELLPTRVGPNSFGQL